MPATAIKRDRAPEHGSGPPNPPRFVVQRNLIERRPDGLWTRPYYRWRSGNPLLEMIDGDWSEFAPGGRQ